MCISIYYKGIILWKKILKIIEVARLGENALNFTFLRLNVPNFITEKMVQNITVKRYLM